MRPPLPSTVAKYGTRVVRVNGIAEFASGPAWRWRAPIYTADPYDDRQWLTAIQRMYNDGVRMFSFLCPLTVCWDDPAGYDWTLVDDVIDRILGVAPQSLLLPRIFLSPPDWWERKYPEELMGFEGPVPRINTFGHEKAPLWKYETRTYLGTDNPSMASEPWRRDAGTALGAFVRHTWEKYPGHFFGYQPAFGTCGEWGVYGTFADGRYGTFGFDKPTIREWRRYLDAKYPGESHAAAMPPGRVARQSTDLGGLKIPSRHREWIDWIDFHEHLRYETINHFCRVVKQASPKPTITVSFGSGGQMQMGASGYHSHSAVGPLSALLAQPDIDALCSPNWYVDRSLGAVVSQSCAATVARHKMFIAENDICVCPRSMPMADRSEGIDFQELCIEPPDAKVGEKWFARDNAYCANLGSGISWWYDFGLNEYHGLSIRRQVRDEVRRLASEKAPSRVRPHWAVLVDDPSVAVTEGLIGYYRQFRNFLNHQWGDVPDMPDLLTIDDWLEHADEDGYRLCIFRDAFWVSEERCRMIRAALERNHVSAIWFYAAGQIADDAFSADRAELLTRFRTKVYPFPGPNSVTLMKESPFTKGMVPLPQATAGTQIIEQLVNPLFVLDDPEADVLGQLESLELPGIGVKYRADGAFDLWSASPWLRKAFWRNVRSIVG